MNTKKQHRNDNLQKSSMIFLQLGLILAMLFVYGLLESQFEKKEFVMLHSEVSDPDMILIPDAPDKIKIQRPVKKVELTKPKKHAIQPEKIKIENPPDKYIIS